MIIIEKNDIEEDQSYLTKLKPNVSIEIVQEQ